MIAAPMLKWSVRHHHLAFLPWFLMIRKKLGLSSCTTMQMKPNWMHESNFFPAKHSWLFLWEALVNKLSHSPLTLCIFSFARLPLLLPSRGSFQTTLGICSVPSVLSGYFIPSLGWAILYSDPLLLILHHTAWFSLVNKTFPPNFLLENDQNSALHTKDLGLAPLYSSRDL